MSNRDLIYRLSSGRAALRTEFTFGDSVMIDGDREIRSALDFDSEPGNADLLAAFAAMTQLRELLLSAPVVAVETIGRVEPFEGRVLVPLTKAQIGDLLSGLEQWRLNRDIGDDWSHVEALEALLERFDG